MVVTGGGTGGHLFPGIAVAEAFLERFADSEVMFIGAGRPIDNKVLAGRKFRLASVRVRALKGKSPLSVLKTIFQLPLSLLQAMKVLKNFGPDIVLGVGGYVTGPVVLAARLLGIPTAIHEQNSVPGLANRLLGKIVDRVFLSIPGSEKYFAEPRIKLTGNPVRKEFRPEDAQKEKAGFTLFVLGGSQGAHKINLLVTEALAAIKQELPDGFLIIHQTGTDDRQMVKDFYSKHGIQAQVKAFVDDMLACYRQADLLVSRAGATSLAEITVMHKPAILIPFPYAADDHQAGNARFLVDGGGAVMYREEKLTGGRLAEEIKKIATDADLRRRMALNAGRLARPDATENIIGECMALIN